MKKGLKFSIMGLSLILLTSCNAAPKQEESTMNNVTESREAIDTAILNREDNIVTSSPANNTPTAKVDLLLTSAPEINLIEGLSSTSNEFKVQSGSYTWSYLENKETVSMVACGAHPLDLVGEKAERLRLPQYNKIDYVPYIVSCVIAPDELSVNEWDISELGNTEAEMLSSKTYEATSSIALKPDRVYEIIATWDEEKLAENGFCGEASYVVITEKQ